MEKPKLVISVKEARKLLGKDAKCMSDEDIEQMIINFQSIIRLYMKNVPKV